MCVPNWLIHNKWTDKAGIKRSIAHYVDRNIDYGTQWVDQSHQVSSSLYNDERIVVKQLRYFYKKDRESKYRNKHWHVKAFYIHHLLDYFRETRFDIQDLDLVFTKFLQEKVIDEIHLDDGKKINFQKEISTIFDLFRNNKDHLFADLEGDYISPTTKKNSP
ncbi:MAG: hypothetical protein EU531_05315 [Promethearchaeota archaeon]|nr:MAG: hypothetical protein EU531_05315 [Candidatus Lokiarchaeota archaeon]